MWAESPAERSKACEHTAQLQLRELSSRSTGTVIWSLPVESGECRGVSTGQKSHRVCTGRPATRCFVLNSRIPPVHISSESTVRCRTNAHAPREKLSNGWDGRACEPPAQTQVEAYTRRLPEEGLEAVALQEDPGEEPFCSPADAPVATGWRRERRPVAHATREARNRKGDREGSGRQQATTRYEPPPRCTNARARRPDPKTAARRRTPPSPTLRPPTRARARPRRRNADGPLRHLEPAPRTEQTLQPRTASSLRRYGSILPTSLTCIDAIDEWLYTLETCCEWWVRTDSRAAKTGPGFSRAAESAPDAARAAALYRYLFRISRRADSTDTVLYEEERTLPGDLSDVSRLACVTAVSLEKRRDATDIAASSAATSGDSPNLGPTDPCSTAVGTGAFSTSVFESLVQIFATTTEICTRGRLHPGSRPRLPCSPWRTPTHRGIGQACASFSFFQRKRFCRDGPLSVRRSSAIHFRGRSIQQVSCYTLLSGFLRIRRRPSFAVAGTP
ncbi:unnamed protein product [Acanthosepion pharaonis]|uniref:Uncharacterized protein n=1 Tax=Acanthosepion pharaonis TaxID=158019 RepID=A0A812BAQ0_ACAPH|nr:unnamed protein product [Sepia pharaonis]